MLSLKNSALFLVYGEIIKSHEKFLFILRYVAKRLQFAARIFNENEMEDRNYTKRGTTDLL